MATLVGSTPAVHPTTPSPRRGDMMGLVFFVVLVVLGLVAVAISFMRL
ncbi:hypothetical protein [Rubrivirga marina]|nr:hypothetical protein [Rubrivirga marina]